MRQALASVLVVGLAIVSTGCPGTGGGNGDGGGEATTFAATLDGGQEVPAVQSDGDGVGAVTLSAEQGQINYLITAGGLSGPVTAAHFHQGAEGVDGDIVLDIGADVSASNGEVTVEGGSPVDADFVAALLAGEIYVNLHTDLNPGGEIRGQLEQTP